VAQLNCTGTRQRLTGTDTELWKSGITVFMVKVGVVVSTQTLTWQYSHLQQLSNVIQTSLSI